MNEPIIKHNSGSASLEAKLATHAIEPHAEVTHEGIRGVDERRGLV